MLIEKDIIYVKLANYLLAIKHKTKHNTDGDEIYHGTKGLVKINTRLMVKVFNSKTSFVLCNRVVTISFDAKHSFVA